MKSLYFSLFFCEELGFFGFHFCCDFLAEDKMGEKKLHSNRLFSVFVSFLSSYACFVSEVSPRTSDAKIHKVTVFTVGHAAALSS